MQAKNGKQPDEKFPLKLTVKQRESMMQATRLRARKIISVTNDARCVTLSVWVQQKNSSRNTACCFRT